MQLKLASIVIIFAAATAAFSQVHPAAKRNPLPFAAGVGYSYFAADWSGYEAGPVIWADWNPVSFRGFGLEAEARDLNYGRTGDAPNLREDTIGGGPIYRIRHFRNVHFYGKFLVSFGSIDFPGTTKRHETRTVYAPGAGGEFRIWRNVWVRGDYEWQYWPQLGHGNYLNPKGASLGVTYDFGSRQR